MITTQGQVLTIEAAIKAPVEKVWELWTDPKHIVNWNSASADWVTPRAENDLRPGGRFLSRMEARDGSWGFDFSGVYNKVEPYRLITYTLDDEREVQMNFFSDNGITTVTGNFEPEDTNSLEMQKAGWQAILDNFKQYAEKSLKMDTLHFEIFINAPVEKVYQTMIGENTYKEWTSEFNPSSNFRGSWDKGANIEFTGVDEDGSTGGMFSRIRENIPNIFISIEHLGMIHNNEKVTSGEGDNSWAGAHENYSFKSENGGTRLMIDVDTVREYKSFFEEVWPKALNRIKALCEQ
jgi:uncharacterized protein YndB with AHSA1/START domain